MPVRGPLGAEVFSGPSVFPHACTRATAPAAAAATQQVAGGWGLGEVARRWVRVWGVREEAGEGVRLVAR
jgi:hypothetical protein